ncbi:MAG: S1 RNA-binding domain-containing protein [bacterium]|nr:S1 RNA-binding domain-containing protein [bacterium]
MEIRDQIQLPDFSMKDLLAKSEFDLPKVGQVLTGDIISISKNSVLVDLGALGTGIVYPGEFYDNPNLQKALKTGQEISAILLDLENDEGYRELSLKQAQMTTAWQDIKDKKENGEIIDTKVVNINKGGLIVEINGIQGFLPLSQLLAEHYPKVEGGDTAKIVQTLQKLRNQDIKVKIIDFSEGENKLIVSERAITDTQLKEEIAKLKIGDVVDAEITDVTDFGAFATITVPGDPRPSAVADGELGLPPVSNSAPVPEEGLNQQRSRGKIEGLIHISEIDWKLIENPRDFLQTGQVVKAKIVNIEGNKVSLSLKALKPDPWEKIEEKYTVGQTINGDIAKITSYGILVQLDEEIYGLVPVSEFGEKKPGDSLKVGDKLNVAIVSIDPKEHKLLLTLQEDKNGK